MFDFLTDKNWILSVAVASIILNILSHIVIKVTSKGATEIWQKMFASYTKDMTLKKDLENAVEESDIARHELILRSIFAFIQGAFLFSIGIWGLSLFIFTISMAFSYISLAFAVIFLIMVFLGNRRFYKASLMFSASKVGSRLPDTK